MPTPSRTTLRAAALTSLTALSCLCGGAALAQRSPYYLGVSQALSYESNLYRLGDGQVLPAHLSKSDTLSGTSLVAGIDQTISRQRVYGSANLRANRYANNKSLDNQSYGLNLALDWATVNNLSGTLSTSADQSLAQFNSRSAAGALETNRNEIRNRTLDASVRLGVVTRYSLEASLGHRQRSYSAAAYDANEFRQDSASLGFRFRPNSALTLGAALRGTQADYPRFRQLAPGSYQSDRLLRQDIDFTAAWQPSGASRINLRLSPTRTRYDRDTSSDFSGLTGSLGWAWQPTGKLKLNTTASRDTGQSSDAVNLGIFGNGITDYSRTTDALGLRANYELSAKIGLNAGLVLAHRALRDSFSLAGGPASVRSGSDNTRTLSLGARWQPSRAIQVGCDANAENRSSSNALLSVAMSGNSVSCFGQFVLQ